jgi:hypothetical protein
LNQGEEFGLARVKARRLRAQQPRAAHLGVHARRAGRSSARPATTRTASRCRPQLGSALGCAWPGQHRVREALQEIKLLGAKAGSQKQRTRRTASTPNRGGAKRRHGKRRWWSNNQTLALGRWGAHSHDTHACPPAKIHHGVMATEAQHALGTWHDGAPLGGPRLNEHRTQHEGACTRAPSIAA